MTYNNTKRGVDRANLDPTVNPSDDFYDYACGGWMKANPLKPEFARYGTFDELRENNRIQLRDLITGLDTKNAVQGSVAQKIGDLYTMGLDSDRLNAEGAQPVMADILTIRTTSRTDLPALLATCIGTDAFFNTGVEADMMDSDKNAMYWSQGGLGLGDRDYYLEDSDNAQSIRDAYRKFVMTLTGLAGYAEKDRKRITDNVMKIETALARAAMPREELRDPAATYNPMSIEEIEKNFPNIGMRRYFAAQGIDDITTVIIGQPKSLAEVDRLMAELSETELHDYITAGYLASAAEYLSDDFVNAKFELSKVVSGVEQPMPRWKRALGVPNALLGEAVGQLYVEKYFPLSAKEKMLDLVSNLKTALGEHIDNLSWMSDTTKARAREKLEAFSVKIGYPDKWRDYSSLTIDIQKSYWDNIKSAIRYEIDYNLSDWGKPVDKSRWYMPPQIVNAYYSPLSNEICFPAGILQAPYFNPDADAADLMLSQ